MAWLTWIGQERGLTIVRGCGLERIGNYVFLWRGWTARETQLVGYVLVCADGMIA